MNDQDLKAIFKAKQRKEQTRQSGKIVITPGFVSTTFLQFKTWFSKSNFMEGCFYCKTTNIVSQTLYELQRNGSRRDATRGGKRGKRLELDRKDPNRPYDELENLVWCCYWCNNAKSNFFSEEEFRSIGEAVGLALSKIKHLYSPNGN